MLETIYTSGNYQFLYTAMVTSNSAASSYLFSNYNTGYTPTVYFDGGHGVYVGGSSNQSNYTSRIVQASTRAVPTLKLAVKLNFISTTQLSVEYYVKTSNQAPATPAQVAGPVLARTDAAQQYVANLADADGDLVFCRWILDKEDTTAWFGPYHSGDTSMISKTWQSTGSYEVAVQTKDYWDFQPVASTPLITTIYKCGDADGSGSISISDAVKLIAHIFGGGTSPSPPEAGDANCSGGMSISDAVYLIAHIFGGGPAPCNGC